MRRWRLAAGLACALAGACAHGQTVSLSGSLGNNALLVIDGKPRQVAVGSTVQGVRLVSVTGNDAVVEVGGKRVPLQLGGAQVNLGGVQSEGGGQHIVITSGSGGHFVTSGAINGKTVRFMVDTGATSVVMSQDDADRIGLAYKNGQRGYSSTANGMVAVYRANLGSVRIGDVLVYDVDAIVTPAPMPYVLLGNSYLGRFQMRRDNDRMTLDKRY